MALQTNHVKNIINYLTEKKSKAEEKLKEYHGPVMSDIVKNSPHMQLEYTRLTAIVDTIDDALMAISQFCDDKTQTDGTKKKR